VAPSSATPDFYVVLQVHPDADFEVIEAAYRQLMKKHHPDKAGNDPSRIAAHEARAKAINEAFRVLRDPEQRRRYDLARIYTGTVRPHPSEPASPPPRSPAPPAPTDKSTEAPTEQYEAVEQRTTWWFLWPLGLLSAAYYLLPGPYEWEAGSGRELVAILMLPVVSVSAFLLATGRLASLLGHAWTTNAVAWGLLVFAAALCMRHSLLPVVAATVPALALLSGWLDPTLQQAHLPVWLAWCLLASLNLIFFARFFVFSVIPTLGIIWFITR
jgi:hypothetical protein